MKARGVTELFDTWQEIYNQYKQVIPKEYREESFPNTVTSDDILTAPAYTVKVDINKKPRKGGFLISSGQALNPEKVKELRDK